MEKKQKKSYNKNIKVITAIIALASIIIILINKNVQSATSNITLKVDKSDADVSYSADTGTSDSSWQGTCIAGNYIVVCAVKSDDTGNIFVFDKNGNQKQKIAIPNGGHHCNSITYDSNKSYIIISAKAKAPIAYKINQSTGVLTKITLNFNRTEQRSNGEIINPTSIAYNPIADNFVVLYSYNSHFYIYSSSDFYNNNHTNATKTAYPCITYNSSYYCQQSTAKNNFWYYLVGTKNSSGEWTNYIYIYDLLDNGQLVDIIQESSSKLEMEGITFPDGSGQNLYVSWHAHKEGTSYKKFLLYKTKIKSNDFYRYKATFDGNGGTNGKTISKYYKERTSSTLPLGTLSTPTRTGYIFDGWYTSASGGSKISVSTTLTKDTTFYAHWNLENYSITYNLNGGTATNPTNYNITSNNITLNNPTKTGYKFTGWTGTGLSGGSTSVTIAKGSTGNRAYTANWTPNTNTAYKVVHQRMNLNGSGYVTVETENKTGTTGVSVTPDVKSYTGFTSPSKQTATIAPDGSTTITYQYARNKYSYTLETIPTVNTSGSTPTGSYYYGETITLRASANNGYEWYTWTSKVAGKKAEANTTFTMPAESVTMTPVVIVKNYTITYNLNGGTQDSSNTTSYNIESKDITLKNPTRTGYTFTGWTGTGLSTKTIYVTIPTGSTGDRTYIANWTQNDVNDNNNDNDNDDVNNNNDNNDDNNNNNDNDNTTSATYTVIHKKMNVNGVGYTTEETEKLTAKVGTSVTPKLKYYLGFTEPSTQTKTVAADGSTTITYLYTRNKYEYTLKTVSGVDTTGSTSTGSYYFGTIMTLKATPNNGYTWNKWESSNSNLASSQTKSNTTFTMPNGDITMTPNVKTIKYTITYNLDGGTATNPENYTVESEKIILNNPQKDGYEFMGWTGSNGNTPQKEVIIPKGSIEDKNYIANWKQNDGIKYTVNHWLQNIDGDAEKHNDKNYTLRFSEELSEKIDNEVKPKTINYKGFTEPEQITIKIKSDGSQVVDYYYVRNKYKLTVIYKDKYSNDIIESESKELYYEQEYKLSVDLDNYTYLENVNKLEDDMPANNLEINLYYAINLKDTITVKYVNEETNEEIVQEEIISGYEGKKYSTEVKEIDGYQINENKFPKNSEGTMTKENIEVIYYYTKIINGNSNQEDSIVNNNESVIKNGETTNNYGDKTTAKTIIPYAGISSMILIIILAITISGTISYIEYKKNNIVK